MMFRKDEKSFPILESNPDPWSSRQWWKEFLKQDRGAVMLEYVLLLMGCFLTLYATIEPLKDAFLTFLTGIYEAMTLP